MIIFTDIDDTLMKTKRKIKDPSVCEIGAYSESGEALSYIDSSRKDFIQNFLEKHLFIPVTARSFSALERVQLNFNHEKVINFGAHILDKNNNIVSQWNDRIIHQQNIFNTISKVEFIKNEFKLSANIELIERNEKGTFVFLNFRNKNVLLNENIEFAQKLNEFLSLNNINDFYLYITDRDVTLIPQYIKKELAVEFLLEQYSDMTSIGIGDHKNDFSFMHLCDFSIFPNDSSIAKLLKEFK